MDIILSNSSDKPIYEQISSQVKAQILSGALAAGAKLPSIRTLASDLGVSVTRPSAPTPTWSNSAFHISHISHRLCHVVSVAHFRRRHNFRRLSVRHSRATCQ